MKVFKHYSIEIISFIILVAVYFFLRLIQILNVPMFTDEAIYTRWTQIAFQDSTERFISLTDGKQPLFIWINMFFMRFIHDPLLSGRLVSVAAGFATMIGLYFLAQEVFKNRWISILSMFLYVIFPFSLIYDRMAIYDSLVGTFYIWSLYVAILLIRKIRLDIAFILGFVMGGGALNKSIGLYSMYLLPFTAVLFNFKTKEKWKLFAKWIMFAVIASIIAESLYSILRLSPWFYIISQKNDTFFYPLKDLLHMPLAFWINNFINNFHGLLGWLITYMTWPLIVLVLFSAIFYKEFWKEKILLFLYFILPFCGFALIAKVMYPRYIFFMSLSLLPLAAYSLLKIYQKVKNLGLFVLIGIVFVSLMLYADFFILTNFDKAPIPDSDLNQYVNDWPAGGGLKESVSFFREQAQHQKIYIGTEGTFGLLPYGLEIYLKNNPNIEIHGFWPVHSTPPQEVIQASKKMPTYFVFYQPCLDCSFSGNAPTTWSVHLIKRYTKGIGKTYFSIYQLENK